MDQHKCRGMVGLEELSSHCRESPEQTPVEGLSQRFKIKRSANGNTSAGNSGLCKSMAGQGLSPDCNLLQGLRWSHVYSPNEGTCS